MIFVLIVIIFCVALYIFLQSPTKVEKWFAPPVWSEKDSQNYRDIVRERIVSFRYTCDCANDS